jgi:1-acyl-sn-glycerol-3-phosphate acyltransferase
MFQFMPFIVEKLLVPCISPFMHLFFKLEIIGSTNLKPYRGKAFILAGNHTSWLDVPTLLSATLKHHDLTFMVAEAVFSYPLIGKIVAFGNTLPIAKNKELSTLKTLVKRLTEGIPVVIFPEGKLSETGALGVFHQGMGFLQRKTQVAILPFAISGGFQAWAYNERFPTWFKKMVLTFGEPITYEMGRSDEDTVSLVRQQVVTLKQLGDAIVVAMPASEQMLT